MIRDTSIEVYRQIRDEGLLTKLNWEVYHALWESGPSTIREIYVKYFEGKYNDRSISPRFKELTEKGVIEATRKRVCRVSGRTVYEWELTKRLPIKVERAQKTKCKHCDGRGFIVEQQTKLF